MLSKKCSLIAFAQDETKHKLGKVGGPGVEVRRVEAVEERGMVRRPDDRRETDVQPTRVIRQSLVSKWALAHTWMERSSSVVSF